MTRGFFVWVATNGVPPVRLGLLSSKPTTGGTPCSLRTLGWNCTCSTATAGRSPPLPASSGSTGAPRSGTRPQQGRRDTDKTRATTLRAIVRCVDDLGDASAEFLTDRDTALMNGVRADGSPIYAPDWIDTAALLGTRPRACRPYRAKTKGKDVHLCQAA